MTQRARSDDPRVGQIPGCQGATTFRLYWGRIVDVILTMATKVGCSVIRGRLSPALDRNVAKRANQYPGGTDDAEEQESLC